MSIAGGVSRALEAAHAARFEAVQVFVKNQRQWKAAPLREDELTRWNGLLNKPGFGPAIAHATYLINLASPDPALYERSRDAFAEELLRCQQLSIPCLVFHPGAALSSPRDVAVDRVARALDEIFCRYPDLVTTPLLETTAGQGSTLGDSMSELGRIIALLDAPHRVGVCVDTCHVFAAGYDIRDKDVFAGMLDEAERAFGLDRIRCLHLNDSKGECGSRLDRHEHIGRGHIGAPGFANVLCEPIFYQTPMIIETPKGEDERGRCWDRRNVARLRSIATRVRRAGGALWTG